MQAPRSRGLWRSYPHRRPENRFPFASYRSSLLVLLTISYVTRPVHRRVVRAL